MMCEHVEQQIAGETWVKFDTYRQAMDQLAAANARIAELGKGERLAWEKAQKYRESTDRFAKAYIDKLNDWQDAIDREAKAEVQCDELKKANSELASAAIEIPPYKATLLAENRRMREALERLVDESERRVWIEKEENRDLPHLARAIDLAQQALKGTDNEKD